MRIDVKGLAVLIMLFTMVVQPKVWAVQASPDETTYKQQEERIDEVLRKLMEQHLNSNLDIKKLTDGAIRGMVNEVGDPYTTYFTDGEFDNYVNKLEGNYTGVGIYLRQVDEHVMVDSVIDKTPAAKAGIISGDEVLSINGQSVAGQSIDQLVNKMQGEPGTALFLEIMRDSERMVFTLHSEGIHSSPVDSLMLDNKIGYINLFTFSEQSPSVFGEQINKLQSQGMKGFILDLRDNSGGYFQAAVDIAKMFVGKATVVNIVDRTGINKPVIVNGTEWKMPMVVLVNGGTASAAEILTAALQDYHIAHIIGTTTYGKGVVQEITTLKNGGVLKYTVDEYFSPMMRKINDRGITPDIDVRGTDNQLLRAISELNGKVSLNLMADGTVTLSGYPVQDRAMAQRINGQWYIVLRSFADTFNCRINWDPKKQGVIFGSGAVEKTYNLKMADTKLVNGRMLLSVSRLAHDFSSIRASQFTDRIIIRTN